MVAGTSSPGRHGTLPIVGVAGCGVTGSRVAARLLQSGHRVAVFDPRLPAGGAPRGAVIVDLTDDLLVTDVVVCCGPAPHAPHVEHLVRHGIPVVSVADDLADVRALLDLDDIARAHGVPVVIGAGMVPGLSGLLARMAAAGLHVVDEVHVAAHGTAGPACAAQHHDALGRRALGWHDGEWIDLPGGSGRELVWFPEPIAAHDCYRGALADPLLLRRMFPSAGRLSARVSATRRDRLTARLPMLTPPHADGDLGAVRVEVRGSAADGARLTSIAGAAGPTGELAAAVCAATVDALMSRALTVDTSVVSAGVHSPGDAALDALDLLHRATRFGVRVQEFTGVARATHW